MPEFEPNNNENPINHLTNRPEITEPKNEQEELAKAYLSLAQEQKNLSEQSIGLIRKIDNTTAELHTSPDINQKLIDVYREELRKNQEKEEPILARMQSLFENMDQETKEKYLTRMENEPA